VLVTTGGEVAGFLVPVSVAAVAGAALDGLPGLGLMVVAGVGEGAVLGAAQGRVLRRVLPGFSTRDWVLRTAGAAGLAWALGMVPSSLGRTFADLPPGVQIAVTAPAGVALLLSIGVAQWTVLRRHLSGALAWIGWSALGWLAGLAVLLAVVTPLWRPGQSAVLIAAIGVLGGLLMAGTLAATTGWGLVRLLRGTTRRNRG